MTYLLFLSLIRLTIRSCNLTKEVLLQKSLYMSLRVVGSFCWTLQLQITQDEQQISATFLGRIHEFGGISVDFCSMNVVVVVGFVGLCVVLLLVWGYFVELLASFVDVSSNFCHGINWVFAGKPGRETTTFLCLGHLSVICNLKQF